MKVKILSDIVIPSGTVMQTAPTKTKRYIPYFEAIIGFGKNNVASFVVDNDTVKEFPDKFQVVES